jgi:ATP-dependent RNA helicase DBP3
VQVVEVVGEADRERLLRGLLQKYHPNGDNRVLVFALYKKEAARLERSLQNGGWNCIAIHGDKSQTDRIHAVASFKSKKIPLLIATDVAARGLDIPDVEVVINFSFPL